MDKTEFIKIRKKLNRTQAKMAELLGVSKKTIESYEQGNRKITDNMSRITYYLLFKLNKNKISNTEFCWQKHKCPINSREQCVAWQAEEGVLCWSLNLKIRSLRKDKKTETCFDCDFFKDNLNKIMN